MGLELAARAGYDPRASVSLWNKMATASKNQGGLSFLSTHPSGPDRIKVLEANVPKVDGLYKAAKRGLSFRRLDGPFSASRSVFSCTYLLQQRIDRIMRRRAADRLARPEQRVVAERELRALAAPRSSRTPRCARRSRHSPRRRSKRST